MVRFMPHANLMVSVNPATGETLAEVAAHSAVEAGDRLVRCREAFRGWSRRPVDERVPVPGALMSGLILLLPSDVTGPRLLNPAMVSLPVTSAPTE